MNRLEYNLIHRFNLGDVLRRSAARHPERLALTLGARQVTYHELDGLSNRFARDSGGRGGTWRRRGLPGAQFYGVHRRLLRLPAHRGRPRADQCDVHQRRHRLRVAEDPRQGACRRALAAGAARSRGRRRSKRHEAVRVGWRPAGADVPVSGRRDGRGVDGTRRDLRGERGRCHDHLHQRHDGPAEGRGQHQQQLVRRADLGAGRSGHRTQEQNAPGAASVPFWRSVPDLRHPPPPSAPPVSCCLRSTGV